jgi:hypothetical protein
VTSQIDTRQVRPDPLHKRLDSQTSLRRKAYLLFQQFAVHIQRPQLNHFHVAAA